MSERKEITRSMEEITASARVNMQDMIHRAIGLGQDCLDAKELLGHGKFLPWLKELGLSSSTAANYMKVAREVTPGSRLESLSYSKVLALLAAPAEEREQLAKETEDKSAAEVRRLIEERNRAAEAANAETTRANAAEADAKRFYDDNARLNKELLEAEEYAGRCIQENDRLIAERKKMENQIDKLRADLLTAENNRVEVEKIVEKVVEKVPEDYEELKRRSAGMLAAAEEAEKRAADAEAELEELRANGSAAEKPAIIRLHEAVQTFFANCDLMKYNMADFRRDKRSLSGILTQLEDWCSAMREAMEESTVDAEVAVR